MTQVCVPAVPQDQPAPGLVHSKRAETGTNERMNEWLPGSVPGVSHEGSGKPQKSV